MVLHVSGGARPMILVPRERNISHRSVRRPFRTPWDAERKMQHLALDYRDRSVLHFVSTGLDVFPDSWVLRERPMRDKRRRQKRFFKWDTFADDTCDLLLHSRKLDEWMRYI